MKYGEDFIRAYRAFKESVDFSTGGILPELDSLIWCMLAGVPEVPADEDTSPDAPLIAIYQRVAILKAVFVEVNGDQPEEFIDRGLLRYDQASEMAKKLLKEEANQEPDLD
jgi:hypothetical protein